MEAAGSASEAATVPDLFTAPLELETLRRAFPQFEILAPIGAGGMGRVYKVRQPNLDRIAALKVLPPELARDPEWMQRFTREARALARLNHPNIVQVYDVGQSTPSADVPLLCWLVMEYVDGVSLRQVQRTGGLSAREALALIPRLCDALQYAHEKGVLHRDIKPENILLDAAGTVKIADFGLAKLAGAESPHSITQAGARLGTAAYMAPEQIETPQDVDHRADIYSLGVVFYELLTGGLPLGRFPAPSEKSGTDPRLDHIVFRTLENERERRYQAAGEVRTALESFASQPRPKPVFPTSQDQDAADKKDAEPIPVEPRKLRGRVETPPLPPPPPLPAKEEQGTAVWIGLATVLVLALILGFCFGREWMLIFILAVGLGTAALWAIRVMNASRGECLTIFARPGGVAQPRPHGCAAIIAFAVSLILALAPAALAGWATLTKNAQSWGIEWMGIMAGCGVLSFFAVQLLLRLTGMHRESRVQRHLNLLGWTGALLCMTAMAGSGLMARSGTTREMQWIPAGVNRSDAERVADKVFGPASQFVRVEDRSKRPLLNAGQGGIVIAAAGATSTAVDELLMECASRLDALESGRESSLRNWWVKIGQGTDAGIPATAQRWFAGGAWVMAAGAWLLAIRARGTRRKLAPFIALLVSGGLAWTVYQSSISIFGALPLVNGKTAAPGERQDFVALPPTGTPERAALEWLKAMRAGDTKSAKDYIHSVSLGLTELDTADGRRLLDDLKSARILGFHIRPIEGQEGVVVYCHLATLHHERGFELWETKWMRFRTALREGVPLINDIYF